MLKNIQKIFFLIIFCVLSFSAVAEDTLMNHCEKAEINYEAYDVEAMIVFDKTTSIKQKDVCKKSIRGGIDYKYNDYPYSCETLSLRFHHHKTKSLENLESFINKVSPLAYQRCNFHILNNQHGQLEFSLFKRLLNDFFDMEHPNQQSMLNELLALYVLNDKQALTHKYVKTLLEAGADPKPPNRYGESVILDAFWALNVGGGTCDTVGLIIDSLSPKELAISYPRMLGKPLEIVNATPLMSMVYLSFTCPEELKLLTNKAADINKQDKNGNTALHHYYMDIKKISNLDEAYLVPIEILLGRGAFMNVPNNNNVTAEQLRQELKNSFIQANNCNSLCERL